VRKFEIFVGVVVLSLVGVILFQQYQISGLYGQNRELAVSNAQKDDDMTELMNRHNQLNASYQQILSSLEQAIETLNAKDANFSSLQREYLALIESLQQDYVNLTEAYNALIQAHQEYVTIHHYVDAEYNDLLQKYQDLKGIAIELCNKYGATDGIFILDYHFSMGTVGMTATFLANMTLYNALLTANVTVKVYGAGGTTKTFTYTIPSGATVNKVEGWSGGIWAEDYSNIMIENVERDW